MDYIVCGLELSFKIFHDMKWTDETYICTSFYLWTINSFLVAHEVVVL
jgi:hypothetical protein